MTAGPRVAVLGTGTMGAGMSRSLLRSGAVVTVWNRTPAKADDLVSAGATRADTVAQAVRDVDCVVTMLYDAEAVLAVCDDVVANAGPGTVWMQCATIGLDGMAQLGERVGDRLVLLDAPVLGTKQPAEKGALVVLVSGPETAVDAAGTVLGAIGKRTIYVDDELGHATALKLACNAWLATLTAGAAQSLALARALGVDPRLFLDAIKGGTQDAPYLQRKGTQMLAGDFDPSFTLDAAAKDAELVLAACRATNVATDLADGLSSLFTRGTDLGHGQEDIAAVIAAFRS